MNEINEKVTESGPLLRQMAAIEASMDGIAILNSEGEYIYVNKAHAEVYGYSSPGDLIGKSWKSLYEGRELERFEQEIMPTFFRNGKWRGEAVGKRRDGSRFDQELSLSTIEEGGLVCVVRDVTTRKKAEDALRRSEEALKEREEKLRTLTDIAQDAIIVMDQEGNISFWNPAAERIFGYSRAEAIGKELHALLAPQRYYETYRKGFAHFRETGQGMAVGKTLELDTLKKGGEEFPIELSLSAIQIKDKWHSVGIMRDITRRKSAEESLKKERDFSQALIECMPGTFYLIDDKGKLQRWNKNAEKILGYSAEEIASRSPLDFFAARDKEIIGAKIIEVFAIGKAAAEASLISKEGMEIPSLFTGVRIEIDGAAYLVGMGMDITERKTAEKTIVKERDFSRGLIDSLPGVFYVISEKGKFASWNRNFEEVTGYSSEEFSGLSLVDLFAGSDKEIIQEKIRQALAEGKADVEACIVSKDGNLFPYYFTGVRISMDDETYLVGVGIDIADRKRAEETLRESEERYRSVVDNVGIGIALISPNMEILSLNRQMREWNPAIDVSQRPICFRSFNRPPREEICSYCPTVKTLKDGLVYESVTETPVEGGFINFKVVSSPLKDGEGKVIAAIKLVEDITAHKRFEGEIKRLNEELEVKIEKRTKQLVEAQEELVRKEKLAILGQLAGSVGHELRSPLGVINNSVYFLKNVMPDADESVREYLSIIQNEVDNSVRIISDLLDFARTKASAVRSVSVNDILDRSLVKCIIPEDIKVKREISDELPRVNVDPLQMGQVFQNLIMNAVQAMPQGGALLIGARCVGAGLVPTRVHEGQPQGASLQDFVEISFSDTGQGISPENMKKLFQPLFTTKAKGMGLGLVVSKKLAETNGGRIDVESEPGTGTKFTVSLPAEAGADAEEVREPRSL